MPVDIYGKCGTKKCGDSLRMGSKGKKDDCTELMSKYMFYFSFENSICKSNAISLQLILYYIYIFLKSISL